MSHIPFQAPQAYNTMGAFNVYRATVNLGTTAQQTLFTTLPQMGRFMVVQVWLHIDSLSPDPSGITVSVGTVAAPTSLCNAVVISPISLNASLGVNTVAGTGVVATAVPASTAVIFTRGGTTPTSGQGTIFVSGIYVGARDGR